MTGERGPAEHDDYVEVIDSASGPDEPTPEFFPTLVEEEELAERMVAILEPREA